MSAVNFILRPGRLDIFADGSNYDAAGVFHGCISKIHAISHMPMLMTARGGTMASALLALTLRYHFATFDEVIEKFTSEVLPQFEYYREKFDPDSESNLGDVALGGFSQASGRIELYHMEISIYNDDPDMEGRVHAERNVLTRLRDAEYFSPGLSQAQKQKGFVVVPTALSPTIDRNVERYARTILELQREMLGPSPDGSDQMVSMVGGHAELVTVTKDGISSKILHRWNDQIGEPMKGEPRVDWAQWRAGNDHAGSSVVSFAGGNRHERRKARAAQKGK
jgi:hypothetical protein